MIVLGCIGFVLMVLYDLNQGWWKIKILQPCFALGSFLLLGATGGILFKEAVMPDTLFRMVLGILALFCGGLLFYTLFLAIPFEATYIQEQFSEVVDTGVYALCRHPGVLFLAGFYFFLAPAVRSGLLFWAGVWFSGCNLMYVLMQDRIFFPRCFSNYAEYRKTVPFLIPNKTSLQRCFETGTVFWKSEGKK